MYFLNNYFLVGKLECWGIEPYSMCWYIHRWCMLQHPRSRVSHLDTCNRILHACPCNKLPNKVFMRLSVQFKVSTNCSIKTRNPKGSSLTPVCPGELVWMSTPEISSPKMSTFQNVNSQNVNSQNLNSKCQLFFNFKVAYKEHPCIYMAGTVNLFSSFLSYCGHHLSCLAFSWISHMVMLPSNSL